MKRRQMQIRVALLVLTSFALAAASADAAPPEGKGPDKDKPQQSQGGGREAAPGQQQREEVAANRSERATEAASNRAERAEAKAENRAERAEARSERAESRSGGTAAEARIERPHPHQDRQARANADRGTGVGEERRSERATDHRRDPAERGRQLAQAKVDTLLKALTKFEHARWDSNPHDPRGQGNMGKVDMRSPFGFDKDSGRERSERGRPIRHQETLDLASLLTVDWQITDYFVRWYQYLVDYYRSMLDVWWWMDDWWIPYLEQLIVSRSSLPYISFATNGPTTLDYTVSFGDIPTSFEGDTILVTMTITSLDSYNSYYGYWAWTGTEWKWMTVPVQYDAGEVVVSQTQEVTLSDSGTLTLSYDPPEELFGSGDGGWGFGWEWEEAQGHFELAVTLTEPTSESTYTTTYDKTIAFFICPYGIVYDKATGKPVVGATVTIHNPDGSIVVLDKGANPNVSNPQRTDATGRYNAKLLVGKKYYLVVKAPGYEGYQSPLFSELGHIVREDVALTPLKAAASPAPSPALNTPASLGAGELEPSIKPGVGIGSGFIPGK